MSGPRGSTGAAAPPTSRIAVAVVSYNTRELLRACLASAIADGAAEVVDRVARYAVLQAQSMIDRGEVFTARAMLLSLGRRTYRQLIAGRAWRDGVPGLLRVGILVGFHFYVWLAFWQLSGARRTPEDDRWVQRLGTGLGVLRAIGWALSLPYRAWLKATGR